MLDQIGRLGDRARDEQRAFRELDALPHAPLVLVARIGGLERVGAGADLQHDVHDVLQLHVVDARPHVDPVAGVEPDPLARQATERVVQRLHAHLGPPAALGHGRARVHDVVGHEARIVDLHQEPGVDDRLVLLPHGVGDREQVFLVGLVVGVVLPSLDVRGRDGGDELFLHADAAERGLEVVDVRLHLRLPAISDGAGAGEAPRPRVGRLADGGSVELRERDILLRSRPRQRFGHNLVVADEEDCRENRLLTRMSLTKQEIGSRAARDPVIAAVVGTPVGQGAHHLQQVGRPRQAARVRREDPLAAAVHGLDQPAGLTYS